MLQKNNITDAEIQDLVNKEFQNKSLAVTEQYLEVHQPVLEEGKVKIERIDRESVDGRIIAYIPVENEYFYFAIYIGPDKTDIWFDRESRNIVSLNATSESLDCAEFSFLSKIKPSYSHNKGDLRDNSKTTYSYSALYYEPNPEPDTFEDKLKNLLALLSEEREAVVKLVSKADVSVNVTMNFHYGNQLLGGANISLECLQLLAELKLPISFQITAWGNSFK